MIKNISFTGHMPVQFFAKHPTRDVYVPVLKEANIRKCQRFVIQNLNGTAGKNTNTDFVELYKSVDSDYATKPMARSMYDKNEPIVHLITGYDVFDYEKLGKDLGLAKREARISGASTNSPEIKQARDNFYSGAQHFIDKICKRIKNKTGEELVLNVFFNPIYDKNGKFKKFEFSEAKVQSQSSKNIF